ncbi:MAG: tetratricopeptide repeat protein [Candidatus Latescibacterota bacterium]
MREWPSGEVRRWESGKTGKTSWSPLLTFSLFFLFLCLSLPGPSPAAEGSAEALFVRAGKAYEAEQYEEAVAAYEEIAGMGVADGRVYYNLGNAYFKAGQLGKAILSYERARRLLPRDEDLSANLRFVRQLKVDKDPPEDRNVLLRFALACYEGVGLDALTMGASVLYFMIMLFVSGWIWYGRRFRLAFLTALLFLGAALIPIGGALAGKIHAHAYVKEAIVISDEVTARSGPGPEHTKIFVLHEGTKVRLERRDGDWALVRLESGIRGWLEQKGMEEI